MSSKLRYFAYGSNLHPMRLEERIGAVRCEGQTKLSGAKLTFNKLGLDGSGKGNLLLERAEDDLVFGVLYQITKDQKERLDRWESLNCGYDIVNLSVETNGTVVEAFTYIANHEYVRDGLHPFDWYKDLVLAGARYHKFPVDYLSMIERVNSSKDSNKERVAEMDELLMKLRNTHVF